MYRMLPGTASKFFLKLLVTIPVAPIITGIIVHFRFHIRGISIHKLSYFNFFSASFCTTFLSAGTATTISVHVFSFLFLIITSGLFVVPSLTVLLLLLLLLLYYRRYAVSREHFFGRSNIPEKCCDNWHHKYVKCNTVHCFISVSIFRRKKRRSLWLQDFKTIGTWSW